MPDDSVFVNAEDPAGAAFENDVGVDFSIKNGAVLDQTEAVDSDDAADSGVCRRLNQSDLGIDKDDISYCGVTDISENPGGIAA